MLLTISLLPIALKMKHTSIKPTTIDRLGICDFSGSATSIATGMLETAYNGRWQTEATVHLVVKNDDEHGEQAMQGHWEQDGGVNGTLDKAKSQWPSWRCMSARCGKVE